MTRKTLDSRRPRLKVSMLWCVGRAASVPARVPDFLVCCTAASVSPDIKCCHRARRRQGQALRAPAAALTAAARGGVDQVWAGTEGWPAEPNRRIARAAHIHDRTRACLRTAAAQNTPLITLSSSHSIRLFAVHFFNQPLPLLDRKHSIITIYLSRFLKFPI